METLKFQRVKQLNEKDKQELIDNPDGVRHQNLRFAVSKILDAVD